VTLTENKTVSHLYKVVNCLNGKSYIGMTNNPTKRFSQHCSPPSKNGYILNRAINKYGKDNFEFSILAIGTERCISSLEVDAIQSYNSLVPSGYNIAKGGFGNRGLEWRRKSKDKISGLNSSKATLNQSQLDYIIGAKDLTTREVSDELGISDSIVRLVRKGKTYRNYRNVNPKDYEKANARALSEDKQGCKATSNKLSEEQVISIIHSFDMSNREAAERYSVSKSTVAGIRRGLKWRHLERPENIIYKKEKVPISEETAIKIIESYHLSGAEAAKEFNTNTMSISEIRRGKTWKHLQRDSSKTYRNGNNKK
jgi:group I intron endonuclease